MKGTQYFKAPDGEVFGYDADQVAAGLVRSDLIQMTAAEVGAHLNPPPPPVTREQVEEQRLRAYADPLAGSDRYFAEAQRESLLGNAEAADAAKALGMARFAEIQAEFPWPAE